MIEAKGLAQNWMEDWDEEEVCDCFSKIYNNKYRKYIRLFGRNNYAKNRFGRSIKRLQSGSAESAHKPTCIADAESEQHKWSMDQTHYSHCYANTFPVLLISLVILV